MKNYAKHSAMAIAMVLVILSTSGCATVADHFLELVENPQPASDEVIIGKAIGYIPELLDEHALTERQKSSLKIIKPAKVYRVGPNEHPTIDEGLIIASPGASIVSAMNSIVICPGSLHMNHSANNIVICRGDIDIGLDGGFNESLLISMGKINVGTDDAPPKRAKTLIKTGGGTAITGIITRTAGEMYKSAKRIPYKGKPMLACRAKAKYTVNQSTIASYRDYNAIKIEDGETDMVQWVIKNPDNFKCKRGEKFIGSISKVKSESGIIEAYIVVSGLDKTGAMRQTKEQSSSSVNDQ